MQNIKAKNSPFVISDGKIQSNLNLPKYIAFFDKPITVHIPYNKCKEEIVV